MSRNTDSSIVGLTQDTTNAEIDSLDAHGENHNLSEADEGNRARCIFCSTSQLSLIGKYFRKREGAPLDFYRLLHEQCSTCRPSDDSETQLCDFCRHLRLWHILSCLSEFHVDLLQRYGWLKLEVDFGSLEAIRSRQRCDLCRLVADTISIHGQEAPEVNRSSTPKFAKLKISLKKGWHPSLHIKSNLLKDAVKIATKSLRPSGMSIYKYLLRVSANTLIFSFCTR